ncbi:hypothetical protein HZH66_002580 [Vespula vulgaris]|uniref:Uncharacterized protein n=1 Tax=Vespula vulgaris TaxID=7454 RepID=A0A834KJW5_VESVU|nr:hypothetical protein HZH66_002580 [Vespula vulgaris]
MASSFGCFLSLEEALADVSPAYHGKVVREHDVPYCNSRSSNGFSSDHSSRAIEHEEVPAGLNSSFALA